MMGKTLLSDQAINKEVDRLKSSLITPIIFVCIGFILLIFGTVFNFDIRLELLILFGILISLASFIISMINIRYFQTKEYMLNLDELMFEKRRLKKN